MFTFTTNQAVYHIVKKVCGVINYIDDDTATIETETYEFIKELNKFIKTLK